MKDYNILIGDLNELIKINLEKIKIAINEFEKNFKKPFHIFDLTESSLVFLKRTEAPVHFLNIGFPFPLVSEKFSIKSMKITSTSVSVFLRGEPVRKIQREKYGMLCNNMKIEQIKTNHLIVNKVIYIDPYTFIGDSFIGLHFINKVLEQYTITSSLQIQIISRHYIELGQFYESFPYSLSVLNSLCINDNTLILVPDLIDSHFDFSFQFVAALIKKRFCTIEIIGRNLKIFRRSNQLVCIHNGMKDILLKDSNIEDYMDECINVTAIEKRSPIYKLNKNKSKIFLINPFSSSPTKYIPVDLFRKIFEKIQSQNDEIYCEIIGGMVARKDDFFWIKDLLSNEFFEKKLNERFEISYYSNLKYLITKLKSKRYLCGLTADTSIAHILNFTSTPQVTIYNSAFWDTTSIQSLASDSPLGFARYNINQFPVVNNGNFDEVSESIFSCLNFINGKLNTINFAFINENKKLLDVLFQPITSKANDYSLKKIYIETKDILSELLANSYKYQASWMLNSYPMKFLIEDCINEYPEKSKRIFQSYLKTSPLFKVFTLNESKVN